MPKVSIIVPIYNSERFLDQCIQSLVNQSLKDIEIILVNDASPDNSLEIMEKYAAIDKRIVIINHKENLCGGARNSGIKVAKGNYLGFVDADDWVAPEMYEELYNGTKGETIDVVVGGYNHYYSNEKIIFDTNLPNNCFVSPEAVKKQLSFSGGGLMMSLWRKSIIIDSDLFFLDHNLYCDSIVYLWYFSANSFSKIDKPLYFYRTNLSSISRKVDFNGFWDRLISADDMLKRAKSSGVYKDNKDYIDLVYYHLYLRNTIRQCENRFTKRPYGNIKECINHFRSQYQLNEIKLLKENMTSDDRSIPFFFISINLGYFVMYALRGINKVCKAFGAKIC